MKKHRNKKLSPARSNQPPARQDEDVSRIRPPSILTMALCERVRTELNEACLDVARRHGLTIEGGDLANIDLLHGFDMNIRVGIAMADGGLYSADKALFEVLAPHFGLKAGDFGRVFSARGEMFKIVAINPNRPKYPISVELVQDGRGFKFAVEDVVSYLMRS